MDTSEVYIKMSDCPEIQGLRHHHGMEGGSYLVGDFYSWDDYIENVCGHCDMGGLLDTKYIWLPRQDQLQEMMEPVVGYPNNLVCDFWEWFDECNGIDNDIAFTSMEQLWLAFYMKEKYNKTWDGDAWKSHETHQD